MKIDRVTGRAATIYTPPEDVVDVPTSLSEDGYGTDAVPTKWGGEPYPVTYDIAACRCGDPTCDCDCISGRYPCEHGSLGEGCGS